MRATLTEAERSRLAAILSLLSSDKPGEVVAAGAAATRFVTGRGLQWHDLLSVPVAPPSSTTAGTPGEPWHRPVLAQLLARPSVLSQWEHGFCANLRSYRRLTPNQEAKLREVCERHGVRCPEGTTP